MLFISHVNIKQSVCQIQKPIASKYKRIKESGVVESVLLLFYRTTSENVMHSLGMSQL